MTSWCDSHFVHKLTSEVKGLQWFYLVANKLTCPREFLAIFQWRHCVMVLLIDWRARIIHNSSRRYDRQILKPRWCNRILFTLINIHMNCIIYQISMLKFCRTHEFVTILVFSRKDHSTLPFLLKKNSKGLICDKLKFFVITWKSIPYSRTIFPEK